MALYKFFLIFPFFSFLCFAMCERPMIIAHRGSPGVLPEHTVEGYQLAVEQGADFIECDLSITSDLVLICLHESWLNATSNVASFAQFHDRIRTYDIPGSGNITDYFSVDFTLNEIKTLGKVQQWPFRDQSYNGKYRIATFDEYVDVAKKANRTVGIYPEIKDPKWINSLAILKNKKIEDIVLDALKNFNYTNNSDAIIVQSFDEDTLKYVHSKSSLKLLMLTEKTTDPNFPSDAKLDEWSKFAYAVGPSKDQLASYVQSVNGSAKMRIEKSTDLAQRIHQRKMKIHAYTFRNEDQFLATNFGQDEYAEYAYFEKMAVDGFFTDFTASLHRYLKYTTIQATNTTTPATTAGTAATTGTSGSAARVKSGSVSLVVSCLGIIMIKRIFPF